MPAASCRADPRPAGESYNVGGASERTNIDVVRAICAASTGCAPSPAGRAASPDRLRRRPARPRRPLRHRRHQGAGELGWAPRELRARPGGDGALVSRQQAWWEPIRAGAMPATGSGWARRRPLVAPRLLVTGADGQLGRELLRRGAPRGLRRRSAGAGRSSTSPMATAVAAAVDEVGPDLVVNAAAYTAVDHAESERDPAFAVNAKARAMLARPARPAACR